MANQLKRLNGSDLWYVANIATYRQQAKLTQQSLAELTREFDPQERGVSKETISKMERNHGVTLIKARVAYEALASRLPKLPPEDRVLTKTPPGGASGLGEAED